MKVLVTMCFHVKKKIKNSLENTNLVKGKTFSKHRSSVQPVGQWRGQRDTEKKGGKERKRIEGSKRREKKRGR